VQRVTLAWLAWERTGSAGFVGLVAALSLSPTLVAGPLFGVMADRVNIRRAAFDHQWRDGRLILAVLALALPVGGGRWRRGGAALAIGVIATSAHHPVRMSLGPRLVPREMVQHVVSGHRAQLQPRAAGGARSWRAGSSPAGAPGSRCGSAVLCYVPMLAVLPRLQAARSAAAGSGAGS
jgi:MFS family permease